MNENIEVCRRVAERGLSIAQHSAAHWAGAYAHKQHLDLWQHMLNELEQLRLAYDELSK